MESPPFATLSALTDGLPRDGMPLDAWLRAEAVAGRFGAAEDLDAAVARLIAALRPESGCGQVAAIGPDGANLVLHAQALPDGGLMPIFVPADGVPTAIEESTAADPVEW